MMLAVIGVIYTMQLAGSRARRTQPNKVYALDFMYVWIMSSKTGLRLVPISVWPGCYTWKVSVRAMPTH